MNVFGAFTFGGLIKTFIPGFVWLVALWLFWRGAEALVPVIPAMPHVPDSQWGNALIVAIPVAILLGLLSNIVVFMGVNDVLVRLPVRKKSETLFRLYDWVINRLREEYREQLNCLERPIQDAFVSHADPEYLVLETVGVEHLAYVREQYWYHMEFQLNLLLAIFVSLLGILLQQASEMIGPHWQPAAEWAGFAFLVLGGVCWLLLRAARKNYSRHVAKMTSVMAAAICGEPKGRNHAPATPPVQPG